MEKLIEKKSKKVFLNNNDIISIPIPKEIVVIGVGRLAKACLSEILNFTSDVCCIEPDDTGFPVLKKWCQNNDITYHQILDRKKLNNFFTQLSTNSVIVSAYNIHLFSKEVLAKPNLTIINFHNSILPRHRGRNSPTWSIYEMDEYTGVTWHLVSDIVDKGKVVRSKKLKIDPDVTAIQLTQQTLELGAEVFKEFAPQIFNGELKATDTTSQLVETFHLSSEIPNDGILDLSWPPMKAYAFLRSLNYANYPVFPSPKVIYDKQTYTVTEFRLAQSEFNGIELKANILVIGNGNETIHIQLQRN